MNILRLNNFPYAMPVHSILLQPRHILLNRSHLSTALFGMNILVDLVHERHKSGSIWVYSRRVILLSIFGLHCAFRPGASAKGDDIRCKTRECILAKDQSLCAR